MNLKLVLFVHFASNMDMIGRSLLFNFIHRDLLLFINYYCSYTMTVYPFSIIIAHTP